MPVVGDADGEPVVAIDDLAAVLELQGHAPVLGARPADAVPAVRLERQIAGERIALGVDESDRGAPAQPQVHRTPVGGEDPATGGVVDAVDLGVAVERLARVVAVEGVA